MVMISKKEEEKEEEEDEADEKKEKQHGRLECSWEKNDQSKEENVNGPSRAK